MLWQPLRCSVSIMPGQCLGGDLLPLIELADIVVLAEDAGEVAAGEEDGAGARAAYEGRLLPEMGRIAVDPGLPANPAKAALILKAVDFAAAGADVARLQAGHGRAGARFEIFR